MVPGRVAFAALGVACVAAAAGGTYYAADAVRRANAPRPNILFMIFDDLGFYLGSNQRVPAAISPNLDAIAQRGVVFDHAYCPAPLCNPSRTAMLTGVPPYKSGVYYNDEPWRASLPNAVAMPEYFSKHGYKTYGGGKIFHVMRGGPQFEDLLYDERMEKPDDPVTHEMYHTTMRCGPLECEDEDMGDYKVATWAARRVKRPVDQPWFMTIGFFRPHGPLYSPRKYFEMYPLDKIQMPEVKENDLDDVPPRVALTPVHATAVQQERLFGYTQEEMRVLVGPMARTGAEAIGSMGTDTPIAVLSDKPRMLYDYFQQLFAQVTNPPLDAIREELVTSIGGTIGPEGNLLAPGPDSCRQIVLPHPIIDNEDLAKLRYIDEEGGVDGFKPVTIDILYPVVGGGDALRIAVEQVRHRASDAIAGGANLIILSDRYADHEHAPIPALLAVAAVHHHLIREKTRTRVGLVVETGEAREVHHHALLIGFGAAAVNPYLVFDALRDMIAEGHLEVTPRKAAKQYIKAAGKGILKIMSKMGISTVASYTGAQVFEAIGLGDEVIDEYFTGTTSRLGGIGLDVIAAEVATRHAAAYPDRPEERAHRTIEVGGEYQWRREGEYHLFNPETVFKLQHATRTGRYEVFKEYTRLVDDQAKHLATLRGLFRLKVDRKSVV